MNQSLRAIHNPPANAGRQKPRMGKFKAALLVAAATLSLSGCVFRHIPPSEMQHARTSAAQSRNSSGQAQNDEKNAAQPQRAQGNPSPARSAP